MGYAAFNTQTREILVRKAVCIAVSAGPLRIGERASTVTGAILMLPPVAVSTEIAEFCPTLLTVLPRPSGTLTVVASSKHGFMSDGHNAALCPIALHSARHEGPVDFRNQSVDQKTACRLRGPASRYRS